MSADDVTAHLDALEELHGAIYRGAEDTRRLTAEHDAVPGLIAAVRGTLAYCDEIDVTPFFTGLADTEAIRRRITAALAPAVGDE